MNDATSTSMIIPTSTTRTMSPYYDDELTLIHRSVYLIRQAFPLNFVYLVQTKGTRLE